MLCDAPALLACLIESVFGLMLLLDQTMGQLCVSAAKLMVLSVVFVLQLGPEQAASAAQAAFASATAVLQQKRVEVLIPPQAATWLQVPCYTKPLDCLKSAAH